MAFGRHTATRGLKKTGFAARSEGTHEYGVSGGYRASPDISPVGFGPLDNALNWFLKRLSFKKILEGQFVPGSNPIPALAGPM